MSKEINFKILTEKLNKFINNQTMKSERKYFTIFVEEIEGIGKRIRLLKNGNHAPFEWSNFCEQILYSYGIHPHNINK